MFLEHQLESGMYSNQKRYNKYYNKIDLMDLLFQYFEICKNVNILPIFCRLERLTGIKRRSINYYHIKWRSNASYRPGKTFGIHKRLFTAFQEQQIVELLRIQYINAGIAVR